MPDLDWNKRWNLEAELFLDGKGGAQNHEIYGYHWGDPLQETYSGSVLKKNFIDPYVSSDDVVVEIGPGGGRFTQFLVDAKHLYLVDYNEKMFDIIRKLFDGRYRDKVDYIKSNGSDLPGIGSGSADVVMTFDCFVHLDKDLIEGYMREIRRVLRRDGVAVIHYADQNKELAKKLYTDGSFVNTYPEDLHRMARLNGLKVIDEDRKSISHSSVIVLRKV